MASRIDHIAVNHVELGVEIHGDAPRSAIFVHGFSGRASIYGALIGQLATCFTVTAIDCRAHGLSAGVKHGVTFQQHIQDILAIVEARGIERPVYFGHSMGGLLGLAAAIEAPQAFSAVVAFTPGPARLRNAANPESIRQYVAAQASAQSAAAIWRSHFVRPVDEAALMAWGHANTLVDQGVYENWMLVERMQDNGVFERLGEIDIPTLIVTAAHDPLENEQHQMALQLKSGKEVMFADEGHMVTMENPSRLASRRRMREPRSSRHATLCN